MQGFGLRKYLIRQAAMVAGLIAIVIVHHSSFGQCGNDNDCKGNRICENGQCVDPTPASGLAAPIDTVRLETPQPEASPAAETVGEMETASHEAVEMTDDDDDYDESEVIPEPGFWDIWFNPIGFVQFGPTAGVEFRTVPNLYVGVHGRYAAMGMLYNLLLESRANEETGYDHEISSIEVYPKSSAVGLEFKYYLTFPSRPHMLYFGMFAEYMWGGYTAFEDTSSSYYDYSYSQYDEVKMYEAVHHSIGMGATVGHRWRFGPTKKVLLTVGLLTGVARPFISTKEFYREDDRDRIDKKINLPLKNEFIFMAEVGIGYGM